MKIFKTKKENLEGEFEKRWALKDEKVERIDLSKAKNNIFLNMEVSKGLYKNSKENGYWGEHKKNRALVKKHNEKMIEQEEAKEKSRKEIEIFNRGEGLDLVEYNHDKAFKYSDSIFPYSTSVNSIRNEFYSLDPDTIDNLLVIRKKENNSFTRVMFGWLMSKRREGNNINVLIDDEVNKLKNFDLEFAPKNSSSGTSGLFDETPKYKEYGIYDY